MKFLFLLAFVLALGDVHCPEHHYASCYNTGAIKTAADGGTMHKYHCSCGDEWWVRD